MGSLNGCYTKRGSAGSVDATGASADRDDLFDEDGTPADTPDPEWPDGVNRNRL